MKEELLANAKRIMSAPIDPNEPDKMAVFQKRFASLSKEEQAVYQMEYALALLKLRNEYAEKHLELLQKTAADLEAINEREAKRKKEEELARKAEDEKRSWWEYLLKF